MEVSLPKSSALKRAGFPSPGLPATLYPSDGERDGVRGPLQTVNAPSVSLPLRFMLAGILSLLVGVGWLIARPDILASYHYNQHVIAVTHLFVLGFICSVVMGAMYQLVPVALETKLYSERLAKWQFAFHVVGFVGMVLMFRVWNMKQVGHFGCVMLVGVGLFVFNIVRTLLRAPKWSVVASAIAAALGWISLTVIAGLSIAAAKCTYESTAGLATAGGVRSIINGLRSVAGFMSHFDQISAMHAHAHAGVIGFFVMLIVGVSYKLVPMFALSEVQNQRRAALSVLLLNLGLAGAFVTILLRSPWKLAFAFVIILSLAIYGLELRAILRARKRARLDWGIRTFLTALALLAPLSLLALALSWPKLPLNEFTGQLENVYGFVGLLGVVTFAIVGMLYKILPFLVWFGVYSPHIGRAQLPLLAEMGSERLQIAGYWSYLAGLAVTVAGTIGLNPAGIRAGSALLALSLVMFALNAARVLKHFFRPQLKPLALTTALKKAAA
ncbi:MAG: hypothetical protein EPO07_10980 [Verrucomicrobia bacterium]|nr:MAG: hypothetical protein EPO07_10980 [Verrucomicrobiota bacterium]